jgi:hypothetical protein
MSSIIELNILIFTYFLIFLMFIFSYYLLFIY